jgi:putative transcription factor
MRCEVCGDEIRGQPQRRIIEGGRLTVCGRCAGFGSSEWSPNMPSRRRRGGSPPPPRRPRSEVEATEGLELIQDYGTTIKKARQKRRLNIEDFARMIKEKESVIKKLEKEDLNPDRKLIRKLENSLNLKLLEASTPTAVPVARRVSSGRTMGDIWKLSQSEEKDDEG